MEISNRQSVKSSASGYRRQASQRKLPGAKRVVRWLDESDRDDEDACFIRSSN